MVEYIDESLTGIHGIPTYHIAPKQVILRLEVKITLFD